MSVWSVPFCEKWSPTGMPGARRHSGTMALKMLSVAACLVPLQALTANIALGRGLAARTTMLPVGMAAVGQADVLRLSGGGNESGSDCCPSSGHQKSRRGLRRAAILQSVKKRAAGLGCRVGKMLTVFRCLGNVIPRGKSPEALHGAFRPFYREVFPGSRPLRGFR